MQLCFAAHGLLSWARHISLQGTLRRGTPKTIRHRLLHIAARTTPTPPSSRTRPYLARITTLPDALHRLRHPFKRLAVTEPGPPLAAL